MPRFVLLYHDCPAEYPRPSHCDLMLEADGMLRAWALDELPSSWGATAGRVPSGCSNAGSSLRFAPTNTIAAEQLPDHRLAYLESDGEVSGNRGTVTRLDFGQYVSQEESPNEWALELIGHAIRGRITLQRMAPHEPAWQLKFESASPISAD